MNQNPVHPTSAAPMKIAPWRVLVLALAWPSIGMALGMLFKMLLDVGSTKLWAGLLGLPLNFLGMLYIFPLALYAPFGKIPLGQYLKQIGFSLPSGAWRHVVLGVLLALCTLSGMLAASILTGRYVINWSEINLTQTIFSLNPGIFEEVFYRGIAMILLLQMTKSIKKAALIQIVIFGLAHIKAFDLLTLVDVISVMVLSLAFTWSAYKTRSLLAGMTFHFLHDALLFFVQVPDKGIYIGFNENFLLYSLLWLMIGVACFIIWFAAEKLQVRDENELYLIPVA